MTARKRLSALHGTFALGERVQIRGATIEMYAPPDPRMGMVLIHLEDGEEVLVRGVHVHTLSEITPEQK